MAPVSKGGVRTPDTLKGPVRNCSSPQLLRFCLYHHPNTLSSPSILSPYQWTHPSILWSQTTAFLGIGPASSGTDSSPQAEHLAYWKTEIRNRSKRTVLVSFVDVSILTWRPQDTRDKLDNNWASISSGDQACWELKRKKKKSRHLWRKQPDVRSGVSVSSNYVTMSYSPKTGCGHNVVVQLWAAALRNEVFSFFFSRFARGDYFTPIEMYVVVKFLLQALFLTYCGAQHSGQSQE